MYRLNSIFTNIIIIIIITASKYCSMVASLGAAMKKTNCVDLGPSPVAIV